MTLDGDPGRTKHAHVEEIWIMEYSHISRGLRRFGGAFDGDTTV